MLARYLLGGSILLLFLKSVAVLGTRDGAVNADTRMSFLITKCMAN